MNNFGFPEGTYVPNSGLSSTQGRIDIIKYDMEQHPELNDSLTRELNALSNQLKNETKTDNTTPITNNSLSSFYSFLNKVDGIPENTKPEDAYAVTSKTDNSIVGNINKYLQDIVAIILGLIMIIGGIYIYKR